MKRALFSSRGSIAIAALWVLVILSFLAIGLAESVRQKITVAEGLRARQELRLAAGAAVRKVIADIQGSPASGLATGKEWYAGIFGRALNFSTGEAEAEFTIEDENSKVNLNTATLDELANLFEYAARLGSDEATRLAGEVIDYRDEDDYVTGDGKDGGSEKGAYRQAGLPYGPKNRDFEFIEELLQVKGMTKEIYSFVESYITIYGNGRLDVNTCSRESLLAIGLLPSLADKIIAVREGSGENGPPSGTVVFPEAVKIEEIISTHYKMSPEERQSLLHALTQDELDVVSGTFRILGRTRVPRTGAIGHFVCVYASRTGIRYWAES